MNFFSADKKALHDQYEQLRRQKNALNFKFDSIDFDKRTGKAGKLRVSLERCTCGEFWKRRKPCKHMYRLATDLGLFELDAEKIEVALKNTPHHNLYGCEFSIRALPPKNFVVVDFEKANLLSDSICQVGLVVVKNNRVTEKKSFLIRPPYKNFSATKIHGIKFSEVKNKPNFKSAWSKLIKYFHDQTIAAFALPHDLRYLFATLDRYKLPHPKFKAFDVQANVYTCLKNEPAFEGANHLPLATVAEKFGLEHDAHDALSDAFVTAQIQIHLSKNFPQENSTIYYSNAAAVAEGFVDNEISTEVVVDYCKRLLKNKNSLDYVRFLRKIKQAESKRGIFREKSDPLERIL
ncbi:MAG: SWIM zinc finger family protein [Quinella sp. 1Q5]|nr:SWIM zinc finger family protein [Quinella sp. 1Q5]